MTALVGRHPDTLSIGERRRFAGKWIAVEIYSPETLPLREIAAVGDSAADCAAQLHARGLDPSRFEYTPIKPAF
jgi:hypothetical protein